jgi:NH3-dependent NAD+ synthetase
LRPFEKAQVALSGGVDSSVTAVLGHRALGKALTVRFVENGLMREGEEWPGVLINCPKSRYRCIGDGAQSTEVAA